MKRGCNGFLPRHATCTHIFVSANYTSWKQFFTVLIITILYCVYIELFIKIESIKPPAMIRQNGKMITVEFIGRLGNKMFQYASMLGTADRNNLTAVIEDISVLQQFKLDVQLLDISVNAFSWKAMHHEERNQRCCFYDNSLEYLWPFAHHYMIGYFQCWKYFENIKDKIRKQFRLQDHIQRDANNFFRFTIPGKYRNHIRVGVHIRRGDMTERYLQRYGYTVADEEYIAKAKQYFTKRFSDVIFIVCSDDIPWAKENIKGNNVFYSDADYITDMAILTSCNHTMMTVGSYGWWAAYMTGGVVTYYKQWPRAGSLLDTQINREDYFYPDWIRM